MSICLSAAIYEPLPKDYNENLLVSFCDSWNGLSEKFISESKPTNWKNCIYGSIYLKSIYNWLFCSGQLNRTIALLSGKWGRDRPIRKNSIHCSVWLSLGMWYRCYFYIFNSSVNKHRSKWCVWLISRRSYGNARERHVVRSIIKTNLMF